VRKQAVFLLVAAAVTLGSSRASGAGTVARAESLYTAGNFAAAERAFAPLHPASDDTLITLRRASLQLLHNDRQGARKTLAPLLARPDVPRTAKSIVAESYSRDLDFVHAAPLYRELGREAVAKQMESFAGSEPYRYEGPDRDTVVFVQTDPLPLVQAKVNGRGPYFFLIDTGGADLLVDPVLADSLGCPNFGEEEGTFGGGRRRAVVRSRVASFSLGAATFHDLPASLLDCSRFMAAAQGRRVFGVVGTRVLMRVRATLDYPGGAIVIERPGAARPSAKSPPAASRHVLPIWLGGDHYVLARGHMNDGPEELWFVDTGLAGAGLTAPTKTLEGAGITVPDTASMSATGVGGGGSVKFQMFGVDRFRLGDASTNDLLGIYGAFPPTLENAFGYRVAGIISHAFFRPWRVTFDFDAMQLVLEPGKFLGD
jgi:hypothetical protein